MKRFLLTVAVAASAWPALSARELRGTPLSAPDSLTLPTLDFVTRGDTPGFGQAPLATSQTPPSQTPRKVRPASGTFIDEPNLPEWVAFNWSYPSTIMGLDPADMTETHLVEAAEWPVTVHLRNGNFEGTYFSDNPGGTVLLQSSHATNGLANWERTQFIARDEYGKRPLRTAYDEHADMMYGLSVMAHDKKDRYGFISFAPDMRVDPASGQQVNPLSDIRILNGSLPQSCDCSALAWDPRDGNVIGVSVAGEVIRFDTATGDCKVLFDTGIVNSSYFGGLAYSPSRRGFVWAHLVRDDSGATTSQDFHLIDTDKRTCTLLRSVPKDAEGVLHQVSSLMVNEHYSDPRGPQPVAITADTFAPRASEGSITVQIPSMSENGRTLSGRLRYLLRVDGVTRTDGKSYIEAEVEPGSVRTDRIEGLSDGLHRITVYTVTADGCWSRPLNIVKFVGYDTPETPQGVVLDPEYLSWEPVDTGIHGQDISADGVEYEVWVDGQKAGVTSGTSYRMDFDPAELQSHLAAVYAVNHGKVSQGGFSDRLTVGKYRTLPATFVPEESDVLLATVNDPEADGYTWAYHNGHQAWGKQYASSGRNDDWLFLPPIFFDDDKALYEISFDMLTSDNAESLELRLCDATVTGSGSLLLDKTVNTCDYGSADSFLTVRTVTAASGVKHLAFHPTDMHADIFVRNIRVTKTGSGTSAPAAVSDLEVIPGERGALTSTATFTFPDRTVAGDPIPPSADIRVEVGSLRDSFSTASATGKPGTRGTVIFTPAEGMTDIFAQPSLDAQRGPLAQTSYWAGQDVPAHVRDLRVTRTADPMVVSVKWDSPGTEGYHGGYADPSALQYYLLVKKDGASRWSRFDPVDYTALTLTLNENYDQTLTQFAVLTENAKGSSNKWDPTDITCGHAHALPMRETLPDGFPLYDPIVVQNPTDEYTGSAGFANPAQLKPQYAVPSGKVIGMMPPADGKPGKARLELPYFSTEGLSQASFVAHALLDKDLIARADVYAAAYGTDPVLIGSWDADTPGSGYTPLVFPLPQSMMGRAWVQLYIDASFPGGDDRRFVVLERYSVMKMADNDLALLSVTTPTHIRVNRPATLSAYVCNLSAAPKAAPELTLALTDCTGTVTETRVKADDDSPLPPDRERLYTFTLTPDADMLGSLGFLLSLPDDDLAANNRHEASASVMAGDAMMCTSLTASRDEADPSQVHLAWNEPFIFSGTESMEQMTSFDSGPWLGGFRNIDLDGSLTYSWEKWDFPGEEEPHAFIVFDGTWPQIPATSLNSLRAHTGDKFLLALAPLNYVTANDWLISPEVEPGTEVSFWLNTVSTLYGPDMVGLYYSDGSEDPDDFRMLKYTRKNTEGWEEVSATLPQDARRFAIHYYSNDTFGIMIDDISYTPAGGLPTLHGFELERDGQTLETLGAPVYAHTDTGVDTYRHRYRVYPTLMTADGSIVRGEASPTALLDGESTLPGAHGDTLKITVEGRTIRLTGLAGGTPATLATTDGLTVPPTTSTPDAATWRVTPGLYILKAGARTHKLQIP